MVRADPKSGRLIRRVVGVPKAVSPPPQPAGPSIVMLPSRPLDNAKHPLHAVIEEVSREQGVDPLLVHAVIQVESGYNRFAISPKGAEGLMQLIPSTARELGVRNSFDTRENIEGGVKYLRGLLQRFPDLAQALAAYNAGPGAVTRWQGIPPYAETQAYVSKVGKRYGDLLRTTAPPEPVAAASAEPEYRPLESFLDEQGRLHLRTR